jgi:hypothetical protein
MQEGPTDLAIQRGFIPKDSGRQADNRFISRHDYIVS